MEKTMKRAMTIAVLCGVAVCAAQTKANGKSGAKTASKVLTIPKDATRNADGTYSYTDKDGKLWTYSVTPFGVVKSPVSDADNSVAANTKVFDKGDTVRFERPGPFGPVSWEKKKTDLTDDERKLVDAQTATAKPDEK